jgi:hypothetical protein
MLKALLLPFEGLAVIYVMTFLWKKARPLSPKTYQNVKNSTADNSTMTDPKGKVSIHLGSSWLKLANYIGVYNGVFKFLLPQKKWGLQGYFVVLEDHLVLDFLNPL